MTLVALCSLYMLKSFNFIYAFNCYKQKCKLAPFNLAHPVYIIVFYNFVIGQSTASGNDTVSKNDTEYRFIVPCTCIWQVV